MKRLFTLLAAALMTAAVASAQDVETFNAAVETFNSGALARGDGNNVEALSMFKQALTMFEGCGEEGAEMVAKCKEVIPGTILAIAKELINNKDYDKALETLKEAEATAKDYNVEDVAAEAAELVPDALLRKGTTLVQAKNFADGAAALQEVIALQPENGKAYLLFGQALMNSGNLDGALEALKAAAALGQEGTANKLIGNIYLKQGQALLKGGKALDAAAAIENALLYVENAGAYKLLASSWMKAGKSAKALDAYKKYLEISPNAADAADIMVTIAATAQKAGDKATAIEYYSQLTGNAKYGETAKAQLAALKK